MDERFIHANNKKLFPFAAGKVFISDNTYQLYFGKFFICFFFFS
jgi:hypothetical protein